MKTSEERITTTEGLLAAIGDGDAHWIVVDGRLSSVPSFRLAPGQTLVGGAPGSQIEFKQGEDGVQLSSDNTIRNLVLRTCEERRAIFNDTTVQALGRIELRDVTTRGRVQILARDHVRSGHVSINGLDITAADARAESERPHGYGVHVLQGAFTLWNLQADETVEITADLIGLTAGRDGAPVRGSGIFVGGAGDNGARLTVGRLETGPIYSDGGIAPGTPDCISGGVFVVYGASVASVRNFGPVTTYGSNDMVLDNWGTVDSWVADGKITSHGASGIGFVNFGTTRRLRVDAPIETFGQGARGFNVYAGLLGDAEFDRIVTHADGAVGMQISQPVGSIRVHRGIETFGAAGDSLVKGVVTRLLAIPLSVKPGGSAREIVIAGGLVSHGNGIVPMEMHGAVESFCVMHGLVATGGGFDKI